VILRCDCSSTEAVKKKCAAVKGVEARGMSVWYQSISGGVINLEWS
jgi:hypothetical protein